MKTRFLVKTLITSLIFSLILFLCAGMVDYFQGWLFLITNLISSFINYWTIRNNPELMSERSKVGKNAKKWDKIILGLSALIYLINIVIAGLDSGRYRWSPDFHWSLTTLGIVLTFLGQVIFFNARKENKYFSSVVRIQTDRGHTVCDTGIYKSVRHPGYLGMIISLMGFPLITGSNWSMITTAIAVLLLVIRTYWEDEDLKTELPGYSDYAKKTRRRLIPGIW